MCTDNFKALSVQSEAVTTLGFFLFTDNPPPLPKTNGKQKVVAIKMAQNRNFPDKSCNC